ncbi:MAG: excinuclease ABC subunit UvrC, partial [Lachnospiraceae bacterium]|nr:excinuclease ABC subunit UvrC [Candidatus Equihabitans merdae]
VKQYFQPDPQRRRGPKIQRKFSLIDYFEYIVTDTELEALVLENNLIKEHRPKYNTMLTDDKTYPFIKVTLYEKYPRVILTRQLKKDNAKYYGPYTNSTAVRDTIELVQKLYHIRSCDKKIDNWNVEPCLYHHIGRCDAPCRNRISVEDYQACVDKAIHFLDGHVDEELSRLADKMTAAAAELDFEKAAEYRDLIDSVRQIGERQKITAGDAEDRDIIAVAVNKDPSVFMKDAVVQVFFVRGGKLIGRDHFYLSAGETDEPAALLSGFISQYYAGTPYVPRELLVQHELPDEALLSEYLSQKRGSKVFLHAPKRGMKEKLVEMAAENARTVLNQDRERLRREELKTMGAVKTIADLLKIEKADRMEAFDISNISGYESVGSMVVYDKGKPKRSDYRKFKIKSVEGPNDYASMEEVLTRRFERGVNTSRGFEDLPDLILMDGGRGQVNIALKVLEKMGLDIPVCGTVKDDDHRTRGLYYNNVEMPIDRHSEAFHLITRIQDEAHRFAIEYHRLLRSKGQVRSILDDIPGVGTTRRRALMKHFQNIEAIRSASIDELREVPSMNEASAQSVWKFFHPSKQDG